MKKKPIEMIKNKYTPLIKMEDGLSTLVQFQEKIMAEVIDRQDEEYANFLISQIALFMKENNVSTCFILNKEELIDCLKEHNKLHYEIADLQSQLDQANERLNKKDEEFGRLSCDYKTLLSHYNVLKEKAIVPKFSSGQIVYFANIVEGTVNKFNYMGEDKYNYVVEDKTGEVFIRMKERTFATEREAQAKLQELRGDKK